MGHQRMQGSSTYSYNYESNAKLKHHINLKNANVISGGDDIWSGPHQIMNDPRSHETAEDK